MCYVLCVTCYSSIVYVTSYVLRVIYLVHIGFVVTGDGQAHIITYRV